MKALKHLVIVAAFALCVGARAGEPATNGGSKTGGSRTGYRLPASVLVSCPIMSRLKLSEKQVEQVKKLETETNGEIAAAFKQCEADGKKKSAYYKKRGELLDALNVKIAALLDADQKGKYQAGREALGAYAGKVGKARSEHLKAMRAAGKDKDSLAELRKQYQAKVGPMKAELEKQLDEKVGRKPEVVRKNTSRKTAAK